MSLHRRNPRRDASEPEVVEALLAGGASWKPNSAKNEPDGWVGYRGIDQPAEIKTGNKQQSEGQRKWAEGWRGRRVVVLRTAAHARKLLRMLDLEINNQRPRSIEDDLAEGVR